MSYKDQLISFKQKEATIVQGVNLTDIGFENNGSGKSAIIEGLSIGLLNSCLRKKTTPIDLIRRGEKSSKVSLSLKNTKSKEILTIEREFFSNTKPSTLRLVGNKGDYSNIISVNDGNKKILEKLDITREDLLSYFIISSEKFESFFSVSDTIKKSLIGRFSNSNIIDVVVEDLKEKRKTKLSESLLIESRISNSIAVIEGYEQLIREKREREPETKESFQKRVEVKVEETKSEIVDYQQLIKKEQVELDEFIVRRGELKERVDEFIEKKRVLEVKASEIESIVQKINNEINEVNSIQKQLEMKLIGSIECPECHTIFNPNSKKKLDKEDIKKNITIAINYKNELVNKKEKKYLEGKEDRSSLQQISKETRSLEDLTQSYSTKITRLEGVISNRGTRIQTSENLIAQLEKSIESFQETDLSEMISSLREKIKLEKEKKESDELFLENAQKGIEKLSYWVLTFIKFKTYLSNKVIKVIESLVNEYLERMNTEVRVKVDGYKTNKDGTIKESISVSLERDGSAPFSTYSNGERARVEIAAIFAIQKLINSSIEEQSSDGGLEFTFLDEIIDSVDSRGMFNIMKTLQSLRRTVTVISHVTFDEHSEDVFNTITATKERNITTI